MLRELRPIRRLLMKSKRKKIVVSSIATIFLILLYCLIFTFSDQDGETSGGLSHMISEKCIEIINQVADRNWSQQMKDSLVEFFEHPIRKIAHFCEYAVMAVLLFLIWYPWLGLNRREGKNPKRKKAPKLVKLIIPWVFVSAAMDEMHQLSTPGRNGNIWDVILDTTGGCFGLLCCILIV